MREALLLIGKALEDPGSQVGHSQADHFLVGIDVGPVLGGVHPREDAGVGERDHRDRDGSRGEGADVFEAEARHGESRQAARHLAQHLDAEALGQVEPRDGEGRAADGEQHARDAQQPLEEQDDDQGAQAQRQRDRVGLAGDDSRDESADAPEQTVGLRPRSRTAWEAG